MYPNSLSFISWELEAISLRLPDDEFLIETATDEPFLFDTVYVNDPCTETSNLGPRIVSTLQCSYYFTGTRFYAPDYSIVTVHPDTASLESIVRYCLS